MGLQIRDDRQMKALTGLSQAQFDHLLPVFSDIYQATQQKTYEEGVESGTRRRKPGGGSKGKLPTMAEKLLFVLYYYKTYPTFDVLGQQFEMARSKANENLHKLSPILYDTLVHLELMPYRELATPEDLKAALQGWIASSLMPPNGPIIVQQMMPNSVSITVEKKQHTLKNTVMSLPDKLIVFLGRTFSGHNHDYSMLKQEFPPELDWFDRYPCAGRLRLSWHAI